MERTYIMIKPDGVSRGLIGEVLGRFERKGYRLLGAKLFSASRELLAEHYAHLKDLPFFPEILDHMTSGPVFCCVFGGPAVVSYGRMILGATDPLKAAPGTLRGDFCLKAGENLCHGSDSVENAEKEIGLWFPEGGCGRDE
ncbi:MAG: nucleoside diphosphate kinase [Amphiamblys sp. WSBS2006]|nr:MAG: nucleoside diphosphate kinase [Amphiamblys sp. WSBS2006]